jgi:hypothetical protein
MSKEATDGEIEDVMKDWFRFANDREGGRKRREQARNNCSDNDDLFVYSGVLLFDLC